jgi:phospholipase C
VPMIVISPWSKGGFVNSEVFDHTSLIRFIERRFGPRNPELNEPNITEWRRSVTGDLTSAFNFTNPNDAVVPLPSTVADMPPDDNRHPDYIPTPPLNQAIPIQEPGIRPARPLPYQLYVTGQASLSQNNLRIFFTNTGKAGAVFQVRSGNTLDGPWTYTVTPGNDVSDHWSFAPNQQYDLSIFGPNGFYRTYKGQTSGANNANVDVNALYDPAGFFISLNIQNLSLAKSTVTVTDVYTNQKVSETVEPGKGFSKFWSLENFSGWYDLIVTVDSDSTFERRLSGHVETGRDSISDPAIASA